MERMLLVLERGPDQEADLRKFLEGQHIKSSGQYHRWLSPEDFGLRFGPADTDLQAVTDWLTTQGFQVQRVAAGRTVIEFSGTAGLVRQAFRTEIHKFMLNGEERWANASDPQIPAALAPVVAGVASMNNFPRRPMYRRLGTFSRSKATGEVRPLFTFIDKSGTNYAVGPNDFATIYNVLPSWQAGIDGTGLTIAIVGQSNINIKDVQDFRSLFGLTANDPQIILNGPDPGIVSGDEGEADLDVQWAGAVAKGATIKLVVSESTESSAGIDLSALYIVDNNLAPILSESYGACERSLGTAGNAFYNTLWQQGAAQGITILVSTGDSGSAGCDDPTTENAAQSGLAVSGIASTPFNLAIGGTDFDDLNNWTPYWNSTNTATLNASAKSYIPEATWNDSCARTGSLTACTTVASGGSDLVAASGGPSNCATSSTCGSSAGYPKPAWQTGTGVPSDGVRDIPDASLFSSDGQNGSFYVICQMDSNTTNTSSCDLKAPFQDFQGVGGTSVSAPAFAGIMALVNQKTGERQGNANYVLYTLAAQSGASCTSDSTAVGKTSCIFYDVVKGNNSVACTGASKNCSKTTTGGDGILVNPSSTTSAAWTTTAGYDSPTGLGSVNVANLVNNWTTVSFTPSTTALTLSPTTIAHGQSVNVSINVASGVTPTSATPTGIVSLIAQTNSNSQLSTAGIASFALNGGAASGTTVMLPGGGATPTAYNVIAHYPGDGNFGASDSPPVSMTVSRESSLTKIALVTFDANGNPTSSNAPSAAYGSAYVLRADVTNNTGQACASGVSGLIVYPCPTGAVTVTANGNPLPDQGAPPGSSPTNFTLNSTGYLEDAFVQFPSGSYSLLAAYAGDNSYTGSNSNPDAITITPAATTTSVTVSPTPVISGKTETLTASVSTGSSGAAPTGTVQFLNGTTPLSGTVTYSPTAYSLSTGAFASLKATLTATFSTSVNITAKYSGDSNYSGSTSAPLAITIADFSLSASPNSLTIVASGQSGTSTVKVTPSGGFNISVTLTCTLPASMSASTCALNPPSLASGSGSSVLTINTTAPSTVVSRFENPGWFFVNGGAILALFFLLLVPAKQRRRKLAFALLSLALAAGASVACGGGGGSTIHKPGTPAGVYTITVTATSTNLTHKASVTVTVQ